MVSTMFRVLWAILVLGLIQELQAQLNSGACPTTNACNGNGNCVDFGNFGTYTCECNAGFMGSMCEDTINSDVCSHGHVFAQNAEVVSLNYPVQLPHRVDCYFFVNVHGATRTRITVNYFDFEAEKDGLDMNTGLTIDFSVPYTTYDNNMPLTSGIVDSATFWMNVFTDKNIASGGYNLTFSSDGDDCLLTNTPCQNGGTCIDGWQTYTCDCPTGYEGDFCEIDVDNCRSGPCENGGTCDTFPTGYVCTCTASYTGVNCETGVVIVSQTSPSVNSASQQVLEGTSSQSLVFDLTFSPGSQATYSIGGSGSSDLWGVDVFFTSALGGTPDFTGLQTLSTLTATQRSTLWAPPQSTTILSIQAPSISVGQGVLCPQLQYFCARLHQGNSPSPSYVLTGVQGPDSLFGCTQVVCRGVEISGSSLSITSGDLQEGTSNNVNFNFNMDSVQEAGSVSGTGLWQFTAFGSTSSTGSGATASVSVPLTGGQGNVGVSAGVTAGFTGLSFPLDLSGNLNCQDVPYICVTIAKGSSPSQDFTLTGVTNGVFTACQAVTCRGVEIIQSSLSVPTGFVLEGTNNNVQMTVSLTSDRNGGSAIGSGLWKMTGFASTNPDGSGLRQNEVAITLSSSLAGQRLDAGATANFNGVPYSLDLRNGPTCSEFGYICVQIEKGNSPSPDFELSPAVTTTCTQIACRGVQISATSLSLTSGEVREGASGQSVQFNFDVTSAVNYGSVSGTNLWEFVAFGSTSADGRTGRTSNYNVQLNTAQANTAVNAGQLARFSGLDFSLDLSGALNCEDVPYICVTMSKSSSANPDFTLTGVSSDVYTACDALTCRGVELSGASVSAPGDVLEGENNNVGLTVTLSSSANSGVAIGSGLWKVTAFASANSDGSGTRLDESVLSLTPSVASTTLNTGSTATLSGLSYPLNLGNGPTCSEFDYICVEVERGDNPSPDFELTPASTVSCVQVTCRGVDISRSTVSISTPAVLVGEANSVQFDYSALANPSYGSISGNNLWTFTGWVTNNQDGSNPQQSSQISLTSAQAGSAVTSGSTTLFQSLTFPLDLSSGSPDCSGFAYLCVQLERNPGASVDFSLSGDLMECVAIPCIDRNECASDPCLNQGTCLDLLNGYQCLCAAGFAGTECQINVDECQSGPCQNGGTCDDGVNRFDCRCVPGYTGTFCEIDINECLSRPCQNGAFCTDRVNAYFCTCLSGFTGPTCATNINECNSVPCQNGGTCDDGINQYTCRCAPGYTGTNCQINIDECSSSPCQNGGTCNDGINQYTCTCAPGYVGINCQTNFDECGSFPCQNGGTCTDLINRYTCTCWPGFTGTHCEIDIDECASSPCQNGGICSDFVNYYTCDCPSGFTGANCNINIDECASSPCRHGGTCDDGIDQFTCRCAPGFTGVFCEIDINECVSSPCRQGNCIDRVNAYECVCYPGYTGTNCDININECASSPCENGGRCMDSVNGYTCNCLAGYTGTHCEIDINECASQPCRNGGSCVDRVNLFTCTCLPGYTGTFCEVNINECLSGPCMNGAICEDGINRYTCQCAPGFTGPNCRININECASDPCYNGGTCMDGINSYTCQCTADWTGLRCETSLDACRSDPCQNGGTCVNAGTNYICECPPGFAGDNCEIDINECASLPCQNGGVCIDGPAMYTCQCPQGLSGTNCQNVGYCDLEGVWYNECNDQITISLTSTGMALGDYKNNVEILTGYSAPTVLVGYANQNCHFPTFGFVVTRDNGKSTTSWSGQCQLCGGEEVLYTTWTNTERVSTCSDIKQATLIGQDKWTRYQQSQAPAQNP